MTSTPAAPRPKDPALTCPNKMSSKRSVRCDCDDCIARDELVDAAREWAWACYEVLTGASCRVAAWSKAGVLP